MASYTGTINDDRIIGTGGLDGIDVSQGGNDFVRARGGGDQISIGGALTAADHIDGGDGADVLNLDGDYAERLTFGRHTVTNVETIHLLAGHDYNLRFSDTTHVGSITANSLASTDHLTIDNSRETSRAIGIYFSGIAVLKGGAGDDLFNSQTTIEQGDRFDGGGGHDVLVLGTAQQQVYDFTNVVLRSIEELQFTGFNCVVTMHDGDLARGHSLFVNAAGGGALDFNGDAETNGTFTMQGSDFNDTLEGGRGADSIDAGAGNNLVTGHGGADTLSGGDATRFVYDAVSDSTHRDTDLITGLTLNSVVDLSAIDARTDIAGNQAFHLVDHFTGGSGQLTLTYDSGRDVTVVAGDVDGDGHADLVIDLAGDQHGFGGLVL